MLGAFVGGLVLGELDGGLVVFPNDCGGFLGNMKVCKDFSHAYGLSGGLVEGEIFSNGCGRGNVGLLFGTPGDEVSSKEEAESSGGSAVSRVGIVRINKADECRNGGFDAPPGSVLHFVVDCPLDIG